jgi:hypothetical protein
VISTTTTVNGDEPPKTVTTTSTGPMQMPTMPQMYMPFYYGPYGPQPQHWKFPAAGAPTSGRKLRGLDSANSADKVDSTNTADVADKAEWGPFGSNAFASVRQWRPCWTCCLTEAIILGGSFLLLSLTVSLSASTCLFFKSWLEGS